MALELVNKVCLICNHDKDLHNEKGQCAVMIDDLESCPCGDK